MGVDTDVIEPAGTFELDDGLDLYLIVSVVLAGEIPSFSDFII
jgi:hypothetical protein